MARTSIPQSPTTLTRREALARCGAVLLGVAATGCAPSFLARALYPEADTLGNDAIERNLTAFVETVLPGVEQPLAIARLFADPSLKLAPYRGVLVADLDRRAQRHGACSFARLTPELRTRVIQDGLESGGVGGRLYNGGVFLAQAAYFGGLWNASSGCPTIGFAAPYAWAGTDALTYPDPENFLAAAITPDGNPA